MIVREISLAIGTLDGLGTAIPGSDGIVPLQHLSAGMAIGDHDEVNPAGRKVEVVNLVVLIAEGEIRRRTPSGGLAQ